MLKLGTYNCKPVMFFVDTPSVAEDFYGSKAHTRLRSADGRAKLGWRRPFGG